MSEILPIVIFPLATIAIAYILEVLGFAVGGFSIIFNGVPNWAGTALLLGVTIATYRSLRLGDRNI